MDIQQEKEKEQLLEISRGDLYFKFLKQKHERFEFADLSQKLAFDKKGEDLLFLNDALTKWFTNSKKEEQKKELLSLIQCIWRVDVYCGNIETVVKKSVSEYVTTEKRNNELVSEKRKLEIEIISLKAKYENEIKSLKSEIEFISSK